MILCDFNYCIYNKKGECILRVISISSVGFCDDCMIPTISDESLEKHKKAVLEKIERRSIGVNKKN